MHIVNTQRWLSRVIAERKRPFGDQRAVHKPAVPGMVEAF